MKYALHNLKQLSFGGASAVEDPAMLSAVSTIITSTPDQNSARLLDNTIHLKFLNEYKNWILNSKNNNLKNLDQFPVACYSLGTSESFDKFYLKNSQRRFRCFRGEYMYHAASWRNYFPNWSYIEDQPLDKNDAVVISMPFSDTGNIHINMQETLDQCTHLGIPVLVDCAFYGLCQGIEFDFAQECITDITFSLSKTFPVSHLRIGMRLTRKDDDDSLLVHHKTTYVNRLGAGVGLDLIRKYSSDYNCNTWSNTQKLFCDQLGVTTSNTVIFGIDHGNYPQYSRGTGTNRLCFARYISHGILPQY